MAETSIDFIQNVENSSAFPQQTCGLNLCYGYPIKKESSERTGMLGKIARHREICDELNELYKRKNHDYGDSFHQTYLEEGLAMSRIRLSDKLNRFKTLSKLSANDVDQQKVTDESMRDTLIDLANYAIMTILELEGGEK